MKLSFIIVFYFIFITSIYAQPNEIENDQQALYESCVRNICGDHWEDHQTLKLKIISHKKEKSAQEKDHFEKIKKLINKQLSREEIHFSSIHQINQKKWHIFDLLRVIDADKINIFLRLLPITDLRNVEDENFVTLANIVLNCVEFKNFIRFRRMGVDAWVKEKYKTLSFESIKDVVQRSSQDKLKKLKAMKRIPEIQEKQAGRIFLETNPDLKELLTTSLIISLIFQLAQDDFFMQILSKVNFVKVFEKISPSFNAFQLMQSLPVKILYDYMILYKEITREAIHNNLENSYQHLLEDKQLEEFKNKEYESLNKMIHHFSELFFKENLALYLKQIHFVFPPSTKSYLDLVSSKLEHEAEEVSSSYYSEIFYAYIKYLTNLNSTDDMAEFFFPDSYALLKDKFDITSIGDRHILGKVIYSSLLTMVSHYADSILAHEVGHAVDYYSDEFLSKEALDKVTHIKSCLRGLHPSSQERPEGYYESEDFADLMAASAVPSQNLACFFISDQEELTFYPLEEGKDDDVHSSPFFRLLHVEKVSKGTIPPVCSAYLETYYPTSPEIKSCL